MQWPDPTPKNIIVRMPNWLGDLVMATPVLADLRKKFPFAKITAMCQGGIGSVLAKDPNIDEIYSYKRPSGWIRRNQHGAIIQAIANGEIAPSEGEALARILDIHGKAIELHDFEKTLNELKEQADTK